MQMRNTRKNFLSMKDFRDGAAAFLVDIGWSQEYNWQGKVHDHCIPGRDGHWQIIGYGYYLASDWQHRYYISHRCAGCGCMVQFNQLATPEGEPQGLIQRLVISP